MSTVTLEEARAELVADLRLAGFAVTERVDTNLNPPAVVVFPANPYLLPSGESFNAADLVVGLELFVVFPIADGGSMVATSGRMVQDLLLGIDDRWTFRDASAPFRATNLGGLPVCRVRISSNVRITTNPEGI